MTARTLCPASRAVNTVLKPTKPVDPVICCIVSDGYVNTPQSLSHKNNAHHSCNSVARRSLLDVLSDAEQLRSLVQEINVLEGVWSYGSLLRNLRRTLTTPSIEFRALLLLLDVVIQLPWQPFLSLKHVSAHVHTRRGRMQMATRMAFATRCCCHSKVVEIVWRASCIVEPERSRYLWTFAAVNIEL